MKALYYLLIVPFSRAPRWFLYGISDILLFPVIYHLVGYRKKVVYNNVRKAFSNKSELEAQQITKDFFHHFCDLIVESIMIFNISKEQAIARCRLVNPEIFEHCYSNNKSVVFVGGHYNNWEMLAVAIAPQVPHQVDAIYAPLTNKFMDDLIRSSRSKYGLRLIPKQETNEFLEKTKGEKTAMIFATDQSPSRKQRAYWMEFMGLETAMAFGAERNAVKYDWPVIYGRIKKVKRGEYIIEAELISEKPSEEPYGYITQKHARLLEQDLLENPAYWLWTHKRWKRKRPADNPVQKNLF
jgi:KDO2-lipid IV(A) lauroyltransferase